MQKPLTPKQLASRASRSLRRLARCGPRQEQTASYTLDARGKREFLEAVMVDIALCRRNRITMHEIGEILREEVGISISERTIYRVLAGQSE